mgnify:CR=1 FL=1
MAAGRAKVSDANSFLYLVKANQVFSAGSRGSLDEGLKDVKAISPETVTVGRLTIIQWENWVQTADPAEAARAFAEAARWIRQQEARRRLIRMLGGPTLTPESAAQIQQIVRIAYEHGVPLVPQTTGFNHGGLTVSRIGERLFLAVSTVKGHTRIIFDKLQVQRRTEAIARARELGLL